MRDKEQGHAFVAKTPHDVEEEFGFAFVEAGSRFVEDQNFGFDIESAGDGDELLFGDGDGSEWTMDIELEAEACECFFGARRDLAFFEKAEACGLAAEEDIVGDGERGDEIDLLVNGADAGGLGFASGARIDGASSEFDGAAVGGVNAS